MYKKLTRACKKNKKRYGSYDKRDQLVNQVSIDNRSEGVDLKSRIGDCEGDAVIGKGHKNAFVTMVDKNLIHSSSAH